VSIFFRCPMPGILTQAVLQCSACSRILGTPACIIDDSYFLRGKPAFLLQDLQLEGCPVSAVEKRAMRSGTYDITWVQCPCGVSLGFIYHEVYGDAFAYKLGKAVVAQDALMIRSVISPATPTASAGPSCTPTSPASPPATAVPVAAVACVKGMTPASSPPTMPPSEGDEFEIVDDDPEDDIIALD
jgi:hypothetical protein